MNDVQLAIHSYLLELGFHVEGTSENGEISYGIDPADAEEMIHKTIDVPGDHPHRDKIIEALETIGFRPAR